MARKSRLGMGLGALFPPLPGDPESAEQPTLSEQDDAESASDTSVEKKLTSSKRNGSLHSARRSAKPRDEASASPRTSSARKRGLKEAMAPLRIPCRTHKTNHRRNLGASRVPSELQHHGPRHRRRMVVRYDMTGIRRLTPMFHVKHFTR